MEGFSTESGLVTVRSAYAYLRALCYQNYLQVYCTVFILVVKYSEYGRTMQILLPVECNKSASAHDVYAQ